MAILEYYIMELDYEERLKRFSLTALNDQLLRGLESFHV